MISSWSSGTGGAGILGSVTFAAMTDPRLLNLSAQASLLTMLVVPVILHITFWNVLELPLHLRKIRFLDIWPMFRGSARTSIIN